MFMFIVFVGAVVIVVVGIGIYNALVGAGTPWSQPGRTSTLS